MLETAGQRLWHHALIRNMVLGYIYVPDQAEIGYDGRSVVDDGALCRLLTVNKDTFDSGITFLYSVAEGYSNYHVLPGDRVPDEAILSLHKYMFNAGASLARVGHYASKVRVVVAAAVSLAEAEIFEMHYKFPSLDKVILSLCVPREIYEDGVLRRPLMCVAQITARLDSGSASITDVAVQVMDHRAYEGDFFLKFFDTPGKGGKSVFSLEGNEAIPLVALSDESFRYADGALRSFPGGGARNGYFDLGACTVLRVPNRSLALGDMVILGESLPNIRVLDVKVDATMPSADGQAFLRRITTLWPGLIDLTLSNGLYGFWMVPISLLLDILVKPLPDLSCLEIDLELSAFPENEFAAAAIFATQHTARYPHLNKLVLQVACEPPISLTALEANAQLLSLVSSTCLVQAKAQDFDPGRECAEQWATEFNYGREALLRALAKPNSTPGWKHIKEN